MVVRGALQLRTEMVAHGGAADSEVCELRSAVAMVMVGEEEN